MGKTLLGKALARAVGGTFQRVQATPDLLPGELTGVSVFSRRSPLCWSHGGGPGHGGRRDPSPALPVLRGRHPEPLRAGGGSAGPLRRGDREYTVVSRRPVVTEAVLRNSEASAVVPELVAQRCTGLGAAPSRVGGPGPARDGRGSHHLRQGSGPRGTDGGQHPLLARRPVASGRRPRRGPVPLRGPPRLLRADRVQPALISHLDRRLPEPPPWPASRRSAPPSGGTGGRARRSGSTPPACPVAGPTPVWTRGAEADRAAVERIVEEAARLRCP